MRAQNVFCRKGLGDNFVFREWGVYGLFLVILSREIIRYHDTEGRGSRCPTSPPSSRCGHDEQGDEGMWIYEPTHPPTYQSNNIQEIQYLLLLGKTSLSMTYFVFSILNEDDLFGQIMYFTIVLHNVLYFTVFWRKRSEETHQK